MCCTKFLNDESIARDSVLQESDDEVYLASDQEAKILRSLDLRLSAN